MTALLLISVILFAEAPARNVVQTVHALGLVSTSIHPPPTEWNKTYGGTGNDKAWSVVQTRDGGYALAGETNSSGAGLNDFWLVKTDAAGNMQWNRTYGGAGDDQALSLVQTSDGGYALFGNTNSFGAGGVDFWLVKTDADGNMQWNKTYGGTGNEYAASLVQASDGGYALLGDTWSYGAGRSDFWLIKTDAVGDAMWNKTYGGAGWDFALSLIQTGDGGYALAGFTVFSFFGYDGSWLIKTDADGNMQWNKMYGAVEATTVIQTTDGGYVMAGYNGSGYNYDFWLVKADVNGNAKWSKTYRETGEDYATSVVQTEDGGYAIAGCRNLSEGGEGFWLVKTDSTGKTQWNQTYVAGDDWGPSMVRTSDGGFALAGCTNSSGAGGVDFWLIKIDRPWYDLTITATMWGTTNPAPGTYTYRSGSVVNIMALPDSNHLFDHWELDGVPSGTANPINLTIDAPHTLGAVFARMLVHIRADGSIDPSKAPISTVDNTTYTFTGDIYGTITVLRSNIILDGNGYTLQGLGNETGINVTSVNDVTIRNTNITGFDCGIHVRSSSGDTVSDNTLVGNSADGILLEYSSNNSISGNTISGNSDGIHLEYSLYNNVSHNDANGNCFVGFAGIWLESSPYNTMTLNNVTGNGEGVLLQSSGNSIVSLNNVVDNLLGIDLDSSSNSCTVSGNEVVQNEYGIALEFSSGNAVYHNNFINNTVCQALSTSEPNSWDNSYPAGGNYWSDYVGVDEKKGTNQDLPGADGVGDTPYLIGNSARDNFPLMQPWAPPPTGHDVAVFDVKVSKTLVGEGFCDNVTVYLIDDGEYAETFNVTVRVNATVIGTQQITNLNATDQTTLTFTWNTSGLILGTYTIGAYASPIPGETNTANNSCTGRLVSVVLVGDITGPKSQPDFTVDLRDIAYIAKRFGTHPSQPLWDPNADLNSDGKIDIRDIGIAATHFGERYP